MTDSETPIPDQPTKSGAGTIGLVLVLITFALCICAASMEWLMGFTGIGLGLSIFNDQVSQTISYGELIAQTQRSNQEYEWTFEGQSGDQIIIRADAGSGGDPYVDFLDSQGNYLASDDDGGSGLSSEIIYTLPYTGTYIIRVSMLSSGGYTLSLGK